MTDYAKMRSAKRYSINKRVFVKTLTKGSGPKVSWYQDISTGGLSFNSTFGLCEGERIELELNFRMLSEGCIIRDFEPRIVVAEVVRRNQVIKNGKYYYSHSMKFIEMSDATRADLEKVCEFLERRAQIEATAPNTEENLANLLFGLDSFLEKFRTTG